MKKILIVAMADSVHTARWLRQFDSDEIEFVLFPSTPHRRIHGFIGEHKKVKRLSSLRISRFMTIGALPLGILDLLFNNFFRSKLLATKYSTNCGIASSNYSFSLPIINHWLALLSLKCGAFPNQLL